MWSYQNQVGFHEDRDTENFQQYFDMYIDINQTVPSIR